MRYGFFATLAEPDNRRSYAKIVLGRHLLPDGPFRSATGGRVRPGAAWVPRWSALDRWARSGAPHSSDVLREEIVDERLVAQPSPFRLAPDCVEDLGVNANRDQSSGRRPQGGSPDSSHRAELGGGSLGDVGEVNPAPPPHRPPAPCGLPGAR